MRGIGYELDQACARKTIRDDLDILAGRILPRGDCRDSFRTFLIQELEDFSTSSQQTVTFLRAKVGLAELMGERNYFEKKSFEASHEAMEPE